MPLGCAPRRGAGPGSSSAGYSNLVGVNASQCTNLKRVAPNNIAGSYLINKLTGVGMCLGTQMPKAGTSLTTAELDTIRAWIATDATQ